MGICMGYKRGYEVQMGYKRGYEVQMGYKKGYEVQMGIHVHGGGTKRGTSI